MRAQVVWIEKGTEVFPRTLRRLRRDPSRILVYHNTDDWRANIAPARAALAPPAARAAPLRPPLHLEPPQREGVPGIRAARGPSHGARREPDLPGSGAGAGGGAARARRGGRLHRPLGADHRAHAAARRRGGPQPQDLRRRLAAGRSLRRARPRGPGTPGDRPRIHARDPLARRERRNRLEVEPQPHGLAQLPDPRPGRLPAARAQRGDPGATSARGKRPSSSAPTTSWWRSAATTSRIPTSAAGSPRPGARAASRPATSRPIGSATCCRCWNARWRPSARLEADESSALPIPSDHRVPVRPRACARARSTKAAASCCAPTRTASAAATSSPRASAQACSGCCSSATPTRPAWG